MAKTAKKGQLTRQITTKECPHLTKNLEMGKVVYEYTFPTYGCIKPREIALSEKPDMGPFFGIPCDAVKWEE